MPYFPANWATDIYSIIHAISLYRHVFIRYSGANILIFADNGKFFGKKKRFEHHYHSLLQIIFEIQKHTKSLHIWIFREKTKTRKALVSTFITTFGVANGVHKSIVDSEVTMDDLFGS